MHPCHTWRRATQNWSDSCRGSKNTLCTTTEFGCKISIELISAPHFITPTPRNSTATFHFHSFAKWVSIFFSRFRRSKSANDSETISYWLRIIFLPSEWNFLLFSSTVKRWIENLRLLTKLNLDFYFSPIFLTIKFFADKTVASTV